jgi:hypothetical protein
MRLWAAYYVAALDAVPAEERLVVHYESFHFDARQEVQRVLRFVDREAEGDAVERAAGVVSDELRRERRAREGGLPQDVEELYVQLCAEAGPVYREAATANPLESGSAAPRAR